MKFDADEFSEEDVVHYGILRKSGRYPWGSGGNVTRSKSFLDYIDDMKKEGLSEGEIAKGVGEVVGEEVSRLRLRAVRSIAINELKAAKVSMVQRLRDRGNSPTAISERTGIPESTVRGMLAPGTQDKANILMKTATMLKGHVDEENFVDVGKGVQNLAVGVSRTRLDTALEVLKEQGYQVHNVKIPTAAGNKTTTRVLCQPGTTQKDAFLNQDKIHQIVSFSDDNGRNWSRLHPPLELDPKRVGVVFKEDGGNKTDGMIYVRPGVKDIELGGKSYAQVRVAVGPDHYLKGMAIYKADLPEGTDVQFHTSKSRTDDKLDVMKKNANEPGFGATDEHVLLKSVARQIVENPGTPEEHVTSAMNLVNEEGEWADWSRNLSSQMLSKQSPILAKTQLNMTYENRLEELKTISSLTNDTVRKKLLKDYADDTDSAAVQLKAAALPRMGVHVILPLPTIQPTQIYAPNFENGEKVVLIRHPHAGPFEIPELTVNNKNAEARRVLGKEPEDAVGIHPSVASWLSGADFDGDTVLVIPNNQDKVKTTHTLAGLKDFDPRRAYPKYDGMKVMSNTQTEMGMISNLITDMSIHNASNEELARAVRHSMVVIDAEKHELNHRLSYQDNNIRQLKQKYQKGGASTLLSRARAKPPIPEIKPRLQGHGGPVDLKTGELRFEPTNRTFTKTDKKTGVKTREQAQSRLARLSLTNDARTLMSSETGTPMERLYADHSNKLKTLANRARLAAEKIPSPKMSSSAKRTYAPQVESLNAKLFIVERNRPLERQAQVISRATSQARIRANPAMDDDSKSKIRRQALEVARTRVGARRTPVVIDDSEWKAIQAGAISNQKLLDILNAADMDSVRSHATPKRVLLMTPTKTSRARQMLDDGYTRAEVARALGVSLTTLDTATGGG